MRNGIENTMRSFIFSSEVNAPGQKGPSVNMLSRFFGGAAHLVVYCTLLNNAIGLMHSLIQFAYGAEFNVLGTMIQGAYMRVTSTLVRNSLSYRPCMGCCAQ
jgi:hypothetical protein